VAISGVTENAGSSSWKRPRGYTVENALVENAGVENMAPSLLSGATYVFHSRVFSAPVETSQSQVTVPAATWVIIVGGKKQEAAIFTATCFSNVAVMGSLDVRPSVRLSVRLSVTLVSSDHIH